MYGFGAFLRRMVCCALLFCMLMTAASALPSVSADSAALYNASTGEFIFEKNADERRGMASTTKIMTALVALRHGNPDAEVTVSAKAVGVEGSSLYLKAGEKMTLRELLYGLMLRSANDAAEAIAEVDTGRAQAAFIINPTRVRQIKDVALAGDKMPQKSTYFYPKILTGLLFNHFQY